MKNEQSHSVEISVEQAKLLGSAQRIKIIGALDRSSFVYPTENQNTNQ
ncbi:hypothetical protein J14TS5_01230 [Paenibacillus lautus]|nr:hypothetical protein [Paenibacillus lautus]GIO95037.1 hypothetical protein J14TS5_01230 [Paenibacillus lautus]